MGLDATTQQTGGGLQRAAVGDSGARVGGSGTQLSGWSWHQRVAGQSGRLLGGRWCENGTEDFVQMICLQWGDAAAQWQRSDRRLRTGAGEGGV